jgi:hypothetical protein
MMNTGKSDQRQTEREREREREVRFQSSYPLLHMSAILLVSCLDVPIPSHEHAPTSLLTRLYLLSFSYLSCPASKLMSHHLISKHDNHDASDQE